MTRFNLLSDFFNSLDTELNINDCLISSDYESIDSFISLEQALENNGYFDGDVIYYNEAMKYLLQNDSSLERSFAIANDMGYTLENLTSEVLASLLKSDNIRVRFYECRSEIEDFFADLINFEEEAENLNGIIIEENEQVYYIQYDKENMNLCAGTCTNRGFISLVEREVDTDFSLDENLQSLYEEIQKYEQINE